jgi:hypothetical protein
VGQRVVWINSALGRIIALWVVKIAELLEIIIKTILSMVEKVSNTLNEPGVWCRKAGWPIAPPDMAMLVPPSLDDAAGCVLLADFGTTSARITETAGVDRDVFLPAA